MELKTMKANDLISEIISAFTISLLLIPESIAFSFILGLSPMSGIHSTIIMSLVTSIFGGCPALISGSTAAVATSLVGVKSLLGEEYIFLSVIMGGIIQLLMAFTSVYKYIFNIPGAVSSGFLVALAFLIGYSQINNFKDSKGDWLKVDTLDVTILLTIVSTFITFYGFIIFRFKNFTSADINFPGGLLSIVLLYGLISAFNKQLPVQVIGDRGDVLSSIPVFHLPKVELSFMNILKTLPFSIAMAIAGLTESLFMVKDTSKTLGIPENPFQECIAQGVANIISGFCGGIGGCVLVGQTKFNLENGARTRFSSICTSLFFILFTILFSGTIKNVPMPALIGIMIAIAIKSGDWNSLYKKIDKNWIITVFTSLIGFFSGSLALGVVLGSLLHYNII